MGDSQFKIFNEFIDINFVFTIVESKMACEMNMLKGNGGGFFEKF